MPITIASNVINIEYLAADGTKGNSYTNPFTFDDIVAFSNANTLGWEKRNSIIYAKHIIAIRGANTYFQVNNLTIYFEGLANGAIAINTFSLPNVRFGIDNIGYGYSYVLFDCDKDGNSGYLYQNLVGKIEIFNTTFKYYRFSLINGTSLFNAKLKRIIFNGYSTIDFGIYTDLEDIKFIFALFTYNQSNYSLKKIIIAQSASLYCNFLTNAIARNVIFEGNGNLKFLMINGLNRHFYLIDSISPSVIDAQAYVGYSESQYFCHLQSTFKIYADSGSLVEIRDKDNNLIFSGIISSEYLSTVIDYKVIDIYSINGIVTKTTFLKQPFSLIVSKNGFIPLSITNINVVEGSETVFRMKLKDIPSAKFFTRVFNLFNLKGLDGNNPVNNAFIQVQNYPEELNGYTDTTGNLIKSSNRKVVYDANLNIAEHYQDAQGVWHPLHDFATIPEEVVNVYTPLLPAVKFSTIEQRSIYVGDTIGVDAVNAFVQGEMVGHIADERTDENGMAFLEFETQVEYDPEAALPLITIYTGDPNSGKIYQPNAIVVESLSVVHQKITPEDAVFQSLEKKLFLIKNNQGEALINSAITITIAGEEYSGITNASGILQIEIPVRIQYAKDENSAQVLIRRTSDNAAFKTYHQDAVLVDDVVVEVVKPDVLPPIIIDRRIAAQINRIISIEAKVTKLHKIKGEIRNGRY